MTETEILDAVREEITRQGLSLNEISDMAGLGSGTASTILRYRGFNKTPRLYTLMQIVDALGMELIVRRKEASA